MLSLKQLTRQLPAGHRPRRRRQARAAEFAKATKAIQGCGDVAKVARSDRRRSGRQRLGRDPRPAAAAAGHHARSCRSARRRRRSARSRTACACWCCAAVTIRRTAALPTVDADPGARSRNSASTCAPQQHAARSAPRRGDRISLTRRGAGDDRAARRLAGRSGRDRPGDHRQGLGRRASARGLPPFFAVGDVARDRGGLGRPGRDDRRSRRGASACSTTRCRCSASTMAARSCPARPMSTARAARLQSLELAAGLARSGAAGALVTGPVSKAQLYADRLHPSRPDRIRRRTLRHRAARMR